MYLLNSVLWRVSSPFINNEKQVTVNVGFSIKRRKYHFQKERVGVGGGWVVCTKVEKTNLLLFLKYTYHKKKILDQLNENCYPNT